MERIRHIVGEKLTRFGIAVGGQNPHVAAASQQAEEARREAFREAEQEVLLKNLQSRIFNLTERVLTHKKLGFKEVLPNLSDTHHGMIVQFTSESLMRFIIEKENAAKVENKRRTLNEEELTGLRRLLPLRTSMPDDEYTVRTMSAEMIRGMIYQRPKNNPSFPEEQGEILLDNFKNGGPLRLSHEAYLGGRQVLEKYAHVFDLKA